MKTSEALLKIFYRPREVFAALKQDRKGGRILLLLVVIAVADMTITSLSSSWQQSNDVTTSMDRSDVSEVKDASDSRATFRSHTSSETDVITSSDYVEHRFSFKASKRNVSFPSVVDVILTFFALALLLLFEATYLRIVGAIIGLEWKIDQWFALVAFSRIPGDACILLVTVLLTVTLFVSSELLGFESATLTRLIQGNSSFPPSVYYILEYWHLAEIWVIALQTIGFRGWSGKSTSVSLAIVVVPTVFLHGITWWLLS